MQTDETVLATADPSKQESLQAEVIPDPMDSEQPDPLDNADPDAGLCKNQKHVLLISYFVLVKVPRLKKKVPKGTSEYQAEWILDEEDEDFEDEDEEVWNL